MDTKSENCNNWGRDKFWTFYSRVVFCRCYYLRYKDRSIMINNIISGILVAASIASISGLWFWNQIPHIWSIIAAAIQLLSGVAYMFPFKEQIWVLNMLIPEIENLENLVDREWSTIDSKSNEEINNLVYTYHGKLLDLQHKYIGQTHFPYRTHCQKLADKDKAGFLKERY